MVNYFRVMGGGLSFKKARGEELLGLNGTEGQPRQVPAKFHSGWAAHPFNATANGYMLLDELFPIREGLRGFAPSSREVKETGN